MGPSTEAEIGRIRTMLRASGMRWTPQRRLIVSSLLASSGEHITGVQLIERVTELDPTTQPSTVYRTLDMLERNGVVLHSHGESGREEYHVLPGSEHAHAMCERCGRSWEIQPSDVEPLADALAAKNRFRVNVSHLTVSGLCADCAANPKN